MNSQRRRGSKKPNRGGGRFNKPQNSRGRGDGRRGKGRGSGSGGMARKQDSFQCEDEVLQGYDDSHEEYHEPAPR